MKQFTLLMCFFQLLGCTNTKYYEAHVPSLISGTYTYNALYPPDVCAARVKKKEFCGEITIQLNYDGSGSSCTYHPISGFIVRSSLSHVGENFWGGACCKKTITKNIDGSIAYGSNSSYYPSKLENTKCKDEIPKARYIGSNHYVTSISVSNPNTKGYDAAELSAKGAHKFCSSKGKTAKITNIFERDTFAKVTFKCIYE